MKPKSQRTPPKAPIGAAEEYVRADKKELVARWVEALRSGRYKQGKGRLRIDDRFCCLGVLCDLVSPDEWHLHGRPSFHSIAGLSDMPPGYIMEAVGLTHEFAMDLATGNDMGTSFKDIADLIEKRML